MKLKHYGIEKYFDYGLSAFGELSEDRTILAQAAFQKLYVKNPSIKPEEVTIIGDTPNDIKCANAIGARSLIVLAGSSYSAEELAKHKPWKIIKKLPDKSQEFLTELADRS
jgi:phosphoglycolate phosphatase-like HAD superfamily hydrolase